MPAADAQHSSSWWRPDAEAVAIRGERIVFVGSGRDAQAYRGPKTRVLDVAGATVLPGLVDSHTHVAGLGERGPPGDLTGGGAEGGTGAPLAPRARGGPQGERSLAPGRGAGAWGPHYP